MGSPLMNSISAKLSRICDLSSSDPLLTAFTLSQLDRATQLVTQGQDLTSMLLRAMDPVPEQYLMDYSNSYALTQAIQGMTKHESAEKERVRQKLTGFDPKMSEACEYITKNFGVEVRQHCLIEIAKYLAKKRMLSLDRDSKRRKSVLMKWFHDNWPILRNDMHMFQIVNEEVIVDDPEAVGHNPFGGEDGMKPPPM